MVHLASIPNDKAANAPLVKGLEDLKLEPNAQEDEATASVYGSRFAAECLPMHEMPENEMPKEIAYRMIRDDLSLDGNPMLNLASFVTTYMVSLILPVSYDCGTNCGTSCSVIELSVCRIAVARLARDRC